MTDKGGSSFGEGENEQCNQGFNCKICLETVTEPVVTACGHLYCKLCLQQWTSRRWLCPVCRAEISKEKVITLYGFGNKGEDSLSKIDGCSNRENNPQTQQGSISQNQLRDKIVIDAQQRTDTAMRENNALIEQRSTSEIDLPVTVSPFSWMRRRFLSAIPEVGTVNANSQTRPTVTKYQALELEKEFRFNRYLTRRRRRDVAHNLILTEQQIKIWFHNRREKWKREHNHPNNPDLTSPSKKD